MADSQPDTGEEHETGQGADTGPDQDGAETAGQGADTGPDQEPDPQAEVAKWKALARKHEEQAAVNARAAEAAEAAEKRATEAELRLLRAEVAAAKGVPTGLADRLAGTSREELEADADLVLKHMSAARPRRAPAPPGSSAVTGTPNAEFASLTKGG